MEKLNLKAALPHIVAVILFAVISLVYFYPILEGYKLNQGDIEKHKSMSSEINSHKEKYDETALWSGNMFAGMPTYLTTNVRYEGNLIDYLFKVVSLGLPHPARAIFLSLIGFFILFMCLRINPWLAIVGAIAFAFSSYFIIIIEAGHTSKTLAIAFMAPILGGFIETMRGKPILGALLIAVFTALQLYVNHLQITYYLFFVLLFVGVAELIYFVKNNRLKEFSKRILIVLLGATLGIMPSLGNLLITYEYSKESTRSKTDLTIQADGSSNEKNVSSGLDKDYITQWSYGIDETFTLLVPNAKGGKTIPILGVEEEVERLRKEDPKFFNVLVSEYQKNQNAVLSYFGNQPIVSGPVYLGIIVIALALLALLFVRDRLVIALSMVTILTIGLSWGKNFMGLTEFFIDYVPGYNKFRAVAMILVVAEFTIPIMGILFLDKLIKDREKIKLDPKKLYIGLGAILLFVLGIALSPDSFVDLSSQKELAKLQGAGANTSSLLAVQDQIESYRAEVVSKSAWGSLKYLIGASVLLILFLLGKIKKELLIIGVGALVMIDLWVVDKTYLNNQKASGNSGGGAKYISWSKPIKHIIPYEPSSADFAILQNESAENPALAGLIQNRINDHKNEHGARLDKRKIYDLQFAELMNQTHYRVLNAIDRLDQDVKVPYFQKTLGGYHGAKMKKYQELMDFYLSVEHYRARQTFIQGGKAYVNQLLPSLKISNLLNAKYIIGPDNTGQSPEALIKNPYAYGNAWFVKSVQEVENADSSILALGKYDLKSVAVIEKADMSAVSKQQFQTSPNDFVKITAYSPNKLEYNYSANSDQFIVFSEIYYKSGWKAYVNDKEVPITKVDYTLRGLNVQAGTGTITFVFEPFSYQLGQTLVWISSIILLLLIGYLLYSGLRVKK